MTCEQCRESAKFQQYRPTTLTTLFGGLRYDRAYYHCRHCGTAGTVDGVTFPPTPRCAS